MDGRQQEQGHQNQREGRRKTKAVSAPACQQEENLVLMEYEFGVFPLGQTAACA